MLELGLISYGSNISMDIYTLFENLKLITYAILWPTVLQHNQKYRDEKLSSPLNCLCPSILAYMAI